MDAERRRAYNAAFTDALYQRYRARLRHAVGEIPFRLAETPVFFPTALRERIETHTHGILARLSEPARIERMRRAIPARFDAPGMDALPSCAQIDFAIVRNEAGELDGRVVELQGFPSLYAFSLKQSRIWSDLTDEMHGVGRGWHPFFGGLDWTTAPERLRKVVVADEDPESVILLDLDPETQKTLPDFVATKDILGVDAVCTSALVREGRRLFRKKGGKLVAVRRIFNRVVFDELEAKKVALPFAYTDALDVTWCPHPNWYWAWSKYSLPEIDHVAIPRATRLSEVRELPDDLASYVLKPLFSFAGSGVKIDVTAEDIARIAPEERDAWLLQKKIAYARELVTPEGAEVAVEIRVMCLRAPDETVLRPAWNLIRLSRGKMHGVDHNKDLTWVGSSIGLWR